MKAKELVKDKFWIVEEQGKKVGTLSKKDDNTYLLVDKNTGKEVELSNRDITQQYGEDFFETILVTTVKAKSKKDYTVYDYPCSSKPYNPVYDCKNRLPIYSKTPKSTSMYAAGYYIIKFEKGWVKSFCPKVITLQRYTYRGPFTTELEMRKQLSNASRN